MKDRRLSGVLLSLWTLTVCCCLPTLCDSPRPVVKVGRSTIQGVQVTVGNQVIHKYLGIRYAKAPIGQQRFRTPSTIELPVNVDATRHGAICPQEPLQNRGMSEDCLFLNIYTPGLRSDQRLPVLVFIHGGGFNTGSSNALDGEVLVAEGAVVLVTINYRLGALGFLSTGDNASMGNYGLWDQRLALTWVHNHIDFFGGDQQRVTLSGESAGAACASMLSLSPLSRDFFTSVIQLSGSASSPWARVSNGNALEAAKALGVRLGCQKENEDISTEALVNCLRQQSVERLVISSAVLFPRKVALSLVDYTWGPVRDGVIVIDLETATAFSGPLLAGLVNNEGDVLIDEMVTRVAGYINDVQDLITHRSFINQQFLPTLMKQAYPALVPQPFPTRDSWQQDHFKQTSFQQALAILQCAYLSHPDDQKISEQQLREMFGDQAFVLGTMRFLQQFCSTQPTFLFYMDHQTIRPGVKGLRHGDVMAYLFGFNSTIARLLGFEGHVTNLDRALARDFRQLLFNFIQTGDPNKPKLPVDWPEWSAYSSERGHFLRLSLAPKVLSHFKKDRMAMWTEELPRVLTSSGNMTTDWQCVTSKATVYFVSDFKGLCFYIVCRLVLSAFTLSFISL